MHLSKGTSLKFGSYVIESVLGQGGFGITYVAEQVGLGRKVAIKEFFMKELCDRDEKTLTVSVPSSGSRELVDKFKAKFIKEAQMISEFKHLNIVSIYDIFEENGTAYYVMEYHDGGSLSSLSLPLPVAEAVRYIRQVASALSYLHKRNIMHLDVKPANVLIDGEGNAVLIDFGISKRYDESGGQTSSTPVGVSNGYAPIEQYSQAVSKFTPATDAYSLGATFYKLLTGNTPPDASLLVCEPESLVIPSSMPSCFAELIRKCLKPNVSGRPQSIDEFISVLDGYVAQPAQEIKQYKKGVEPDVADDETVMPTVNPVNVKKVSSKPHAPKKSPASSVAPSPTKKSRRWLWWLLAAVILVGVGVFVLVNGSDSDADERQNAAVSTGTYNGHEWVDLGLPSGLKWATCNIGASTHEAMGRTYSCDNSLSETSQNFRTNIKFDSVYDLPVSDIGGDAHYDAATANWGEGWRMPSEEDFQELIDNCDWKWVTRSGQNGYLVSSRYNDKSLFLPVGGYDLCDSIGLPCDYWSSTAANPILAIGLHEDFKLAASVDDGAKIRPIVDFNSPVDLSSTRSCLMGHEYVDLSLPSGCLWALSNIGASTPEDLGNSYLWGDINTSDWSGLAYCFKRADTVLDKNRDVARTVWGGNWRMPTVDEWKELFEYTQVQPKHTGLLFTGANGNELFLPLPGIHEFDSDSTSTALSFGIYGSSTPISETSLVTQRAVLSEYYCKINFCSTLGRQSVRPVLGD